VSSYTITITPDNDTTTTTLHLDTSGDQVVLTDLHLHAGGGLSAGQLPAIDYGLLLRAITTSTPTPVTAAGGRAIGAPARGRARAGSARTGTARTGAARARGAAKAVGTAATKTAAPNKAVRGAKKAAAKATVAKKAATARGERAYRRMPDDIANVFTRQPGAAAIAAHYGVPRHTANGWLRRLRDQGVIPPIR
jgi:hypothetical protein